VSGAPSPRPASELGTSPDATFRSPSVIAAGGGSSARALFQTPIVIRTSKKRGHTNRDLPGRGSANSRRVVVGLVVVAIVAILILAGVLYWLSTPRQTTGQRSLQVYLDHIYLQQGNDSGETDLCAQAPQSSSVCSTAHATFSVVTVDAMIENPADDPADLTISRVSVSSPFAVSPTAPDLVIPPGMNETLALSLTLPSIAGHYSPSIALQLG
jgi:type II secretory pathway pseudopilin PulG